jgi:hypothetical protein
MKINPNTTPSKPLVRIRELNEDAEPQDVALVGLDQGRAATDHKQLMADWEKAGIVGRPEQGRVFPQDGERFLNELPFMYRSVYFWAEKIEQL